MCSSPDSALKNRLTKAGGSASPLQTVRRSDAQDVVRAWADPEISRWGRYGAVVPQRENIGQWLDWNHDQWHFGLRAGFAVCAADGEGGENGGELVGSIMVKGYTRSPSPAANYGETGEVGYWILP